ESFPGSDGFDEGGHRNDRGGPGWKTPVGVDRQTKPIFAPSRLAVERRSASRPAYLAALRVRGSANSDVNRGSEVNPQLGSGTEMKTVRPRVAKPVVSMSRSG